MRPLELCVGAVFRRRVPLKGRVMTGSHASGGIKWKRELLQDARYTSSAFPTWVFGFWRCGSNSEKGRRSGKETDMLV